MTLQVRWCPQCGTRRTGYFRFCGRCGLDFDEVTLRPHEEEPVAERRPEPTTPIWPSPVQWPPPDEPVAETVPPAAEAAPPPTPVAALAQPETEVDWPSISRRPATYVQQPAQRPLLARQSAVPESNAVEAVGVPVTSRRPAITLTRIAIVALAALLLVNAVSRAISQSASTSRTPEPTTVAGSPLVGESATPSTAPERSFAAITPGPSFAPPPGTDFAVVTKVIDGDTIRVNLSGTEYSVRYIGIDAPESDASDPALKQMADSATAANAGLVEDQEVYLEREVSDRDPFDRLLRDVWLVRDDGTYALVNLELVLLGFAEATLFEPDDRYAAYLATAESAARSAQRGMWAPGTQVAPSSPAEVVPPVTLVDDTTAACHPSYNPCLPIVDDLDCPDVRAMGIAPVTIKGPDEYRLDRDKDGLGCE